MKANGEAAALADELRIVEQGDAWHGPSLREVLEGVTPERAAARPLRGGHTVWELVLHVAAWNDVWRRRLQGERLGDPEEGDFPALPEPTAEEWAAAQARVRTAHQRLVERVARMTPGELDGTVAGRDYTGRFLVRGAIRHVVSTLPREGEGRCVQPKAPESVAVLLSP